LKPRRAFAPSCETAFALRLNRPANREFALDLISKTQRFCGFDLWKNVSPGRQSVRIWNSETTMAGKYFARKSNKNRRFACQVSI
jgi:hypothetical protein